ncbi:Protein N-acetyltransferase, RimJ/RimL family [Amycolatopsis arida]|uniref:Protein N-acetyltransferase, RimJ/RimL family n=1 Tax=Amycolatopsis arida TaxID=587909 RepID=A0A1I5TAJ9_9PSEU|nr:GNAT family protein [Amycolatopsis arida]TDX96165.1 RimJ/RimL family protein N-acetyltransferase [Amycolatopsis arida]SFP79861.1 Protein N-acetyltransferase, RimJ/RimL family [Amycolatopsis arida]
MVTGELVRLRPLEPEDADAFWRWHNDPDVVRWLVADYDESLAQIRRRFAERGPNTYSNVAFGIETLAEGRLIGSCTLRDASPETARAWFDLYIGEKDHWGGGFGTDATRTLCRYGFEMMRLHSIALWVVAENAAAVRAYEKVGFRVDGRHRESFRGAGRWHDELLMSLLEGELT